ncbi:hypothetical protein GCM10022240_19340 [Microbacterium kribbense]|uniref:Cardiolipin synthase N-terminal domain-containing protein n=1 Tax=Microbacterium kribbense TaxID=433645 RepID=A0ABP7GIY9_9MICO
MPFLFSLLVIAAMVFAVVDIITRDDSQIRYMPKLLWLLVVILLSLLGVILWFVLGREYPQRGAGAERPVRAARPTPRRTQRSAAPTASPSPAGDPRSTEQQLADLEREIEEERLRAELRRRQSGTDSQSGSSAG